MGTVKEVCGSSHVNAWFTGLVAILFVGLMASSFVYYKLKHKGHGEGLGRGGSLTMKVFVDRLVIISSIIDSMFAIIGIPILIFNRIYYCQFSVNNLMWYFFTLLCFLPKFYHVYIAYVCYEWVVLKYSVARLQRRLKGSLMVVGFLVLAHAFTSLLIMFGGKGDQAGRHQRLVLWEHILVSSICLLLIIFFYLATICSITSKFWMGKKLRRAYVHIIVRFMKVCAMYVVVWGSLTTAGFMTWTQHRTGGKPVRGRGVFFIPVVCYPFLDSLILGKLWTLIKESLGRKESSQEGIPTRPEGIVSSSVKHLESIAVPGGLLLGSVNRAKIFVTTLNCGGVKDVEGLGDLRDWVPLGYDIYCIGVQECLMLRELRQALHEVLGGREAYNVFQTEIGDATVLHGMIALTIFARSSDVSSGAFTILNAQRSQVRNGANLLVTKASNKGMVGLGARYHDTTLAFITCHYAADCRGKKNVTQRNLDAFRTLTELCLVESKEDFDVHLQYHHTFVLGDLNYRMDGINARNALKKIAMSASMEKKRHLFMMGRLRPRLLSNAVEDGARGWGQKQMSLLSPTQEGQEGPEEEEEGPIGWVAARHQRLFLLGEGSHVSSCLSMASASSHLIARMGSSKLSLPPTACNMAEGNEAEEEQDGMKGGHRHTIDIRGERERDDIMTSDDDDDVDEKEEDEGEEDEQRWGGSEKVQMNTIPIVIEVADEGIGKLEVEGSNKTMHLGRPAESGFVKSLLALWKDSKRDRGSITGSSSSSSYSRSGVFVSGSRSAEEDDEEEEEEGFMGPPWHWVKRHDELIREMEKGEVFTGFNEGPITFPPSFRWKPCVVAGDFDQVEVLGSAYSTRKKGDGMRVPSYTDRILFHSLPDTRPKLHLVHYTLCDQIIGSDHRPVSAAFTLQVHRNVIGFCSVEDTSSASHKPAFRPSLVQRSSYKAQNSREMSELIAPSVPRIKEMSFHSSSPEGNSVEQLMRSASGTISSSGPLIPAKVICHFPLLSEDPYAADRQMLMLHDLMDVRHSTKSISDGRSQSVLSGSSRSVEMDGLQTNSSLRTESLLVSQRDLLPNVHEVDWREAENHGLSFKALVMPQVSRHALIMLVDGRGLTIGQGVICLREAFGGHRPTLLTRMMSGGKSKAEERGPKTTLSIGMSHGGRKVGALTLKLRISKRDSRHGASCNASSSNIIPSDHISSGPSSSSFATGTSAVVGGEEGQSILNVSQE